MFTLRATIDDSRIVNLLSTQQLIKLTAVHTRIDKVDINVDLFIN